MSKIFLCYRREDSSWPAQSIYDNLVRHFGSESVVWDVDTIPLGLDFREYLNKEVSRCDILLALIGDKWVEILQQRLDQPNDFVRIEIQAALERKIPVVPVLVDKALMPIEENLPKELGELAYRQATVIRTGPDLQTDLKRLTDGLENLLFELKAEDKAEETKRKAEEERKLKETEEEHKRKEAEAKRKAWEVRKQEEEAKREAEVDKTLDKEYLWDKIVKIIAGRLSLVLSEVVPEASLEDDLGADELDIIELIMTLEEEFDLDISDEDAESMVTVKDVHTYLCAHLLGL